MVFMGKMNFVDVVLCLVHARYKKKNMEKVFIIGLSTVSQANNISFGICRQ